MELNDKPKIAVVGLGYVGLPLAVEFGIQMDVVGFDINEKRVLDLNKKIDKTLEITSQQLDEAKYLKISANVESLCDRDVYIITVPTPVDISNTPDLSAIINASEMVGKYIRKDSIIIYESTVYPGATEEVCVPILENVSGLKYNCDFYCGYSPERINPGDKSRKIKDIKKIVSGSTAQVGVYIKKLYDRIITAGTHLTTSIKVAEAAKVIENTQRDLNIALMNELALIFDKLGIDTLDVLEAAGSKWNFMPFRPGLVGGHCIGVDPYYLVHKANQVGYYPEIISAGRRVNNEIVDHITSKILKLLITKNKNLSDCRILIFGFSFKENCTDYRNSKVIDLYHALTDYGFCVDVVDSWVDSEEVMQEHGIEIHIEPSKNEKYSAAIFAVAHDEFINNGLNHYCNFLDENPVIFDVKGIFESKFVDGRL